MSDADKIRKETHDYLRTSVNGPHYLAAFDNPPVAKELVHRVLNARGWAHELPSFESVAEAVAEAVKSFKG